MSRVPIQRSVAQRVTVIVESPDGEVATYESTSPPTDMSIEYCRDSGPNGMGGWDLSSSYVNITIEGFVGTLTLKGSKYDGA